MDLPDITKNTLKDSTKQTVTCDYNYGQPKCFNKTKSQTL